MVVISISSPYILHNYCSRFTIFMILQFTNKTNQRKIKTLGMSSNLIVYMILFTNMIVY